MKLSSKPEVVVVTIDISVNNAMTTIFAPFDQVTPEEFKRATEASYLGYVHGAMAALKQMKPRGRGVIIQVGSALAYRSIPLQSAYCGTKHAVVGFTDSIRFESMRDIIGARSALTYRLHGKKKTRMTKKKRTKAGSFFSSHYRLCQ